MRESRHLCRIPTVVRNHSQMLLFEEVCTYGLVTEVLDDSDKVGADAKAACQTMTKAFLKSMKTW